MLFGAVFLSIYADRQGRRAAFILSLVIIFFGAIASALAPNYYALVALRCLVGFGLGGNLPVASSLAAEFLPTNSRAKGLSFITMYWGMGIISASLLGLVLSSVIGEEQPMWRWFLGLAGLPSAVLVAAYFVIPESPRFLSVRGRHKQAMQILENVAWVNKKPSVMELIGQKVVNHFGNGCTGGEGVVRALTLQESGGEQVDVGDVRELFRTPIMRRATLCLWMVWFFINFSYFGLVFLLPMYYGREGNSNDMYLQTGASGAAFMPGMSCKVNAGVDAVSRLSILSDVRIARQNMPQRVKAWGMYSIYAWGMYLVTCHAKPSSQQSSGPGSLRLIPSVVSSCNKRARFSFCSLCVFHAVIVRLDWLVS
ncbi:unnamed protein product [Discosporangium mesarthrocarpum]